MKETVQAKPILFNTEMVRAILDGRKTVTRRVVKITVNGNEDVEQAICASAEYPARNYKGLCANFSDAHGHYCGAGYPPYRPGDILYVRETWSTRKSNECYAQPCHTGMCPYKSCELADGSCFPYEYIYKATDSLPTYGGKWRPSIHMPREAARIFLRVTDVRVERLQDIDEDGAIAEGLYKGWRLTQSSSLAETARQAFMWLWQHLTRKAPSEQRWAANPWVWVIEFERCEKPEGFAT